MKAPVDLRKDLFYNIFLQGGGSLIAGLQDRVGKEFWDILQENHVDLFHV